MEIKSFKKDVYYFRLKEDNKMITVNTKQIINRDIHCVWKTILDVEKYNIWRSDLGKIELINEEQFIKDLKKFLELK